MSHVAMPRCAIMAIGLVFALLWLWALPPAVQAQQAPAMITLPPASMSREVSGGQMMVTPPPDVAPAPQVAEPSPLIGLRPPPPLTMPQARRLQQNPGLMQQWQSQLAPVSLAPAPPPPTTSPWQLGPQPAGTPPLSNPLLLTDGTVIAHVSCTGTWYKLTPDNTGSYVNGTWSQIASLPSGYAPRFFSSAVLPDGRVIIEGGEYNSGGCSSGVWTNLGAIYDPVANTWTSVTPPSGWDNIGDAQSTVLANGTYLQSDCCFALLQGGSPATALLNATSLTWTSTGTGKADDYDEEGWTLLPNTNVLTVDAHTNDACGTGTEQYTSGTGAWTSAGNTPSQLSDCSNPANNPSYEMGPQVLRPDGTVIAFGGTLCGDVANTSCQNGTFTVTTHSAIYNSSLDSWSAGPDIPAVTGCTFPSSGCNYTLADAPAALEPNGNVLFAASPNYQGFVTPTHFFELSTGNTISPVTDPTDSASFTSFQWNLLVLPTGQIMALETDGSNVWIYTPSGSPNASWAPAISSAPSSLVAGATYQISGTQFNGLSQGAAYGDDQQAATNYPIVEIKNNGTGHIFFARSFGASTTSVAPSTSVTTNFKVPSSIETGASTLYVIANGISSAGVAVSAASCTAPGDFDSDCTSDLVFQNNSTGALWLWEMNGNQIDTGGSLPLPTPSSGWKGVGTGDFNGDGQPDLVFQNNSTGALWLWEMNGTTIVGNLPLPTPNSGWNVVAVGDFDRDGHPDDLVFQNASGALWLWQMSGTTIVNSVPLPTPSSGWKVVGAGDFSGDGFVDDLVFQNSSTGALWLWEMNGTTIVGNLPLPAPNPNWGVVGVGDINAGGHSDLVFQNSGTGALWLWEMNGTTIVGNLPLPTPDSGWLVRAM